MQISNFFKSFFKSLKEAFSENEDIQKIREKHPKISTFIKNRLDKTRFSGLTLTILTAAAFYIFLLLVGAVEDFLTSDLIVEADARLNALLYAFSNPTAIKFFLWVTALGESPTIIVFAILISILLYSYRKRWQIVSLWLSIIGSEGFTFVAKFLFKRPRPLNAVFLEDSNSFPSGHSTIVVAFYGFLTYLLISKISKKRYKILSVLGCLIIIAAVGFSRLYLRVHYLSDVWTGYLVGALWLVIAISFDQWKSFSDKKLEEFKPTKTKLMFGLAGIAVLYYVSYGFIYHPKYLNRPPATPEAIATNLVNVFTDFKLPRYSETLTGVAQEPMSFVISAKNDEEFIADFEKAGWLKADPIDINSTWDLIKFAVLNKEYLRAPMTPSFWNKQVHDYGFEKSTESKSVRQRHHARFWKTNLTSSDGRVIYVGTVSLDTGIKWFVTHSISPDIDTEREILFSDLQKSGNVLDFGKFKSVKPVLGKNFSGDQFFTEGDAYFIVLK